MGWTYHTHHHKGYEGWFPIRYQAEIYTEGRHDRCLAEPDPGSLFPCRGAHCSAGNDAEQ